MLNKPFAISQQRLVAVGLLVMVLVMIFLLLAPLLGKSLKLHEEQENLLLKLQQYQRILGRGDVVVASMAKIKQQTSTQGYFNSKATEALASAELQEFIKKAIVDAGGQLSSTQTIPGGSDPNSNKDKFNRIVVRVRMTGNSEILRAVLYKMETAKPFIIIDQIDIRPMRGQMNAVTRQLDASNELNVNFQAVSFMRKLP